MVSSRDIYLRLRSPDPTPTDELCTCPLTRPIKLMWHLAENPIACMDCNLEVAPERVPLPEALVDAVADWCSVHGAIELLELDSGAYETWARAQLLDPKSSVVRQGLDLQRCLDPTRRCYYWFFQPQADEGFTPSATCPVCYGPLTSYGGGIFLQRVCETCSVVLRRRLTDRNAICRAVYRVVGSDVSAPLGTIGR